MHLHCHRDMERHGLRKFHGRSPFPEPNSAAKLAVASRLAMHGGMLTEVRVSTRKVITQLLLTSNSVLLACAATFNLKVYWVLCLSSLQLCPFQRFISSLNVRLKRGGAVLAVQEHVSISTGKAETEKPNTSPTGTTGNILNSGRTGRTLAMRCLTGVRRHSSLASVIHDAGLRNTQHNGSVACCWCRYPSVDLAASFRTENAGNTDNQCASLGY